MSDLNLSGVLAMQTILDIINIRNGTPEKVRER